MGDVITTWISVNSNKEVNSTSIDKKYVVEPWTDNTRSTCVNNLIPTKSINFITKGQTIVHSVNVGSGANYLEVDLNWGDKNDALKLSSYTPSASNLGTYRDNSDGSVNGRIHISISPSSGYMQQGTWQFKVYGEKVSGKEDYTFNVYQH